MLDATDAPCPRCRTPLEASGAGAWDRAAPPELGRGEDLRVRECPRCGGMFVPPDALLEILCYAELAGPFPEGARRPAVGLGEVTYVPCPRCHTSMNRVNFGKLSGVIVDVCRDHGTWFDGGELTRVIAFAAGGGLSRTRVRDELEKKAGAARRVEVRIGLAGVHASNDIEGHLSAWREFLHDIFG